MKKAPSPVEKVNSRGRSSSVPEARANIIVGEEHIDDESIKGLEGQFFMSQLMSVRFRYNCVRLPNARGYSYMLFCQEREHTAYNYSISWTWQNGRY
jgi:hypothetical protein